MSAEGGTGVPVIEVAEAAGTCFGVERALNLVAEAAAAHPGAVRTLGPLIHNPRVVAELAAMGVGVVDSPAEAGDLVLVLRSHGVTPEEERVADATCAEVIDATCPFVKRTHRAVETFAGQGRQVVIAGERGHPEVRATATHAPDAIVALGAAELPAERPAEGTRVGVVAQTTLERARLDEVVGALRARSCDVAVEDTICRATSERQDAAREAAARSDVMVVVGGRTSANTRHLADICASACARTHHVESAGELEAAWFAGASRIGVTAGASTPRAHIDEVVDALERMLRADVAGTGP